MHISVSTCELYYSEKLDTALFIVISDFRNSEDFHGNLLSKQRRKFNSLPRLRISPRSYKILQDHARSCKILSYENLENLAKILQDLARSCKISKDLAKILAGFWQDLGKILVRFSTWILLKLTIIQTLHNLHRSYTINWTSSFLKLCTSISLWVYANVYLLHYFSVRTVVFWGPAHMNMFSKVWVFISLKTEWWYCIAMYSFSYCFTSPHENEKNDWKWFQRSSYTCVEGVIIYEHNIQLATHAVSSL